MAADAARYVELYVLEVIDEAGYAKYRAEMSPLLHAAGARFEFDATMTTLLAPQPGLNRVFSIAFPNRAARDGFFRDPDYLKVRNQYFEPSVGARRVLGQLLSA